jgi:hypothetical protein
MDLRRKLDEMGPDYPECHVALVDALRNYIRCCEQITHDLLFQGSITIEEAKTESPHMARCKTLLKEIDELNFDPTLHGFIQSKFLGDRMG